MLLNAVDEYGYGFSKAANSTNQSILIPHSFKNAYSAMGNSNNYPHL